MSLASPDEPLVLADGTMIAPDGKVVKPKKTIVEVPANSVAQREIVALRRRVVDLPAPPKQMHVISAVLTYSLFGLNDLDIAAIIGITEMQVGTIKMSTAYSAFQEQIVKQIIDADASDVRSMFVQHARDATKTMVDLMDAENEAIKLAAAGQILDRAGMRPVDIVEHRHKVEGGLTIKYIDDDEKKELPIIDMEPSL